jgi:hypothetical protein
LGRASGTNDQQPNIEINDKTPVPVNLPGRGMTKLKADR